MEQESFWELMKQEQERQLMHQILASNARSEQFGLYLSEQKARELLEAQKESLAENQRLELGPGILPALLEAFCDSSYLAQDDYAETIAQLQEIFYLYKNESLDELTDMELLDFMREQFDEVCFGDLEYLAGTCLEEFARAVRGSKSIWIMEKSGYE